MKSAHPSRLDRYRKLLSGQAYQQVIDLLDTPVPPAVRLNRLKVDPSTFIETLSLRYGWEVEPVPFCPDGWILKGVHASPGGTLEYRNGHYYIQEASSMLPAEVFRFENSHPELILDMAAAPGGKSTHLAARSGDAGLLVANDASRRRNRSLASNLRAWGALSGVVTNLPGERLGGWLPGVFDKVLLDAPCSGDSLRMSGGSKGREVSDREREALQSQQIALLHSGLDSLREGGELVYATCTAAPEENEAVIQTVLEDRPGWFVLEAIHLFEAELGVQALTSIANRTLDASMTRAVRLWPHHFNTGAFFTARLRKLEAVNRSISPDLNATPLEPIGEKQVERIHEQLYPFGCEIRHVCQQMGLALTARDRFVHAVSRIWLNQLPGLPVVEAGLPVGRWQGDVFLPAHEWVTRFASTFTERRFILDESQKQRWLQGMDLRDWSPPGVDGPILLQDGIGRFLGVGNSSARRVRNLLPRTWVAG